MLPFLAAVSLFGASLAIADSSLDPANADSEVGDSPEDVITVKSFACASRDWVLRYVSAPDRGTCWRVDLHRPRRVAQP